MSRTHTPPPRQDGPSSCPPPIVSIVVPTCNRFLRLRRCIDKIRQGLCLPHEIIVVDGASKDGSGAWLSARPDLRVIRETQRQGAVRAFNLGFRAARGRYVTWLNDDAYPLPGSVEAAVRFIERPDLSDVGLVALYHTWHNERNILHEVWRDGQRYVTCHVRGFPYANFGLLRRELLERVGFADEGFTFFGFDPDLALKIQLEQNLRVAGCPDALVHHDEHHDARKLADLPIGQADNQRLFAKWSLPAPGAYADPRPAYREWLESRGIRAAQQPDGRQPPSPTAGDDHHPRPRRPSPTPATSG